MRRLMLSVKFMIDLFGTGEKKENYLYTSTIKFKEDKAFIDDNTYIEIEDIIKIDPIDLGT